MKILSRLFFDSFLQITCLYPDNLVSAMFLNQPYEKQSKLIEEPESVTAGNGEDYDHQSYTIDAAEGRLHHDHEEDIVVGCY